MNDSVPADAIAPSAEPAGPKSLFEKLHLTMCAQPCIIKVGFPPFPQNLTALTKMTGSVVEVTPEFFKALAQSKEESDQTKILAKALHTAKMHQRVSMNLLWRYVLLLRESAEHGMLQALFDSYYAPGTVNPEDVVALHAQILNGDLKELANEIMSHSGLTTSQFFVRGDGFKVDVHLRMRTILCIEPLVSYGLFDRLSNPSDQIHEFGCEHLTYAHVQCFDLVKGPEQDSGPEQE